ncbi:GNAT family N-acetyltransferase [Vallitalea okinawensis]|uniref:GNAT family N-acetyltransferase n=1 Tax=Vallitalea okinawensis TaxID=2078660 RepID=UPI00147817CC|nr:GNAT family N-acetyltransferase [Vallitalea okinawensis]
MDILLGKKDNLNELEQLYNELNDYLEKGINYPGWIRGVYPIRETAISGIEEGNLYIAKQDERIVGSVILNHKPELAYNQAKWKLVSDYSDVFVVHTFVVHPDYLGQGIGKALLEFSIMHCRNLNAKSIRLDVYEGNTPALKIYEKFGFDYIDTVDLGLGDYGLKWFRLYEKLL